MRRVRWLLASSALLLSAAIVRCSKPCACVNDTMECSHRQKTIIHASEVCSRATRVRLGGNKLRSFPEGLRARVVVVDVSSNRLSALPDAALLNPMTKVLDLSGNGIANVSKELRSLSALETLDVRGNRLTSLKFLPEPCGLRRLEASWNEISTLVGPLHQCSYLTKLALGYNRLTSLPSGIFSLMRRLKLLILTENKLSTLPRSVFMSLGRLKDLRLDKNQILFLPDGLFTGLRSLRNLTLQGNRLKVIPPLGDCCTHLTTVSFVGNDIVSPEKEALRPLLGDGRRRFVDLGGNPILADRLCWVLRVAELHTFLADDGDCACGGLRRGRAIVQMCVAVECGRGRQFQDWVAAVRHAARESQLW